MPVCENCVTLYHGTSAANAEAIVADGFTALDVDALVDTLVRRYSLTRAQILEKHSFVDTRPGDPSVYLTPSLMHATGYAGHAGEAEQMLLAYVFGHLHYQLPGWGHHDPARDAWVRNQVVSTPAIVEVVMPALAADASISTS